MATPTRVGFRAAHPEFSATEDATVDRWLARARLWHDVVEECTYLLTAHLLTLDGGSDKTDIGGGGEVITEQVGQQMVTYQTQAKRPGDEVFTTTFYGKLFLSLENRIPRKAYSAFVV